MGTEPKTSAMVDLFTGLIDRLFLILDGLSTILDGFLSDSKDTRRSIIANLISIWLN